MASYERQTRVDAPLDRVWAFHSTTDGLRALTPTWLALKIGDIEHPEPGARNSGTFATGTEIRGSVAPFWVLPRYRWVSVIESRAEYEQECEFVDRMRDGPLPEWRHVHRFIDEGDQTRIVDHVEFDVPGGWFGAYLVKAVLDVFFAYRHWRTRGILE